MINLTRSEAHENRGNLAMSKAREIVICRKTAVPLQLFVSGSEGMGD